MGKLMADPTKIIADHVAKEEARLDRIEKKIDKLSEAMIDLARAEEKLINIEKVNQQNFDRMNRHSERMDVIEKKVEDNARTVKIIHGAIYVFAVAVIGALTKLFIQQ